MLEPNHIGNFGKATVLTGAGWSRNWGGRLARELWEDLIGHRDVQANQRLRQLLLTEPSFESAYSIAQREPFTAADRAALQQALMDAFIAMEAAISAVRDPGINRYGVEDLLFRFCQRQSSDRSHAGYLFTLNQDLWPERNLINNISNGAPHPVLPGLRSKAESWMFGSNLGQYSSKLELTPIEDPAECLPLKGFYNVVKLHGSMNWRTADGRGAMVIGTGKSGQIQQSPLLSWYWEIFEQVLCAGGVRLLIAGYGFQDEHVNASIAHAAQHHGLRVFIWNTDSNLMRTVQSAPHGAAIWQSLISTCTRPLIEVFPGNQQTTPELQRIRQSLLQS